MRERTVKSLWALLIKTVFLSTTLFILVLGGCASITLEKATTGPGSPDETQKQHYDMLESAIEAKSKNDALVAIALLQADINRWQVSWAIVAMAFHDVAAITDVVNTEDWVLTKKKFIELRKKYRGN